MRVGITMFATDRTISVPELAVAAEARGFHSLYVPEHTHMPVASLAERPSDGVVTDDEYKRGPDPYIALAAAASVTEHIRLGTGVSLVAQHDPIVLAKTVATLDNLAGGRFVLGVGYGWNRQEMADHGVDYTTRRARVREHLLAMYALWSDEVASFTGEFVTLSPSWSWPKPVQQPRPLVLFGGAAGPKLFAHVVELGDGWMPIGGAGLAGALPELRRAADAAGRDPGELSVIPFGTIPDPGTLDHYASLGVAEVVLRIPGGPAGTVLPVLDDYTRYLS